MTLQELLDGLICPRCGWENSFVIRPIDVLLKVGNDCVTVHVIAGVCDHCGEEILDQVATTIVDDAIRQVRDGNASHLTPTGIAYSYP